MGNRDTYDQSLRDLDDKILAMAGHAADAVESAMGALENSNLAAAQAVVEGDDRIDREEHAIEHLCLGLIACQQPVAGDLRKISTAMKVVTDLERLGDAAEDIAEITLRRGTAAAHYVLGGPQGNDNNAFSLGTAATEINVMNGKTAANAMYTGRLAKDQKAGKDLQPTIDKMNALIDDYDVKSKPLFCAQAGLVDEIVDMPMMRNYIVAFTDAVYQNPESICPFHQMLLPRTIRDYDNLKK